MIDFKITKLYSEKINNIKINFIKKYVLLTFCLLFPYITNAQTFTVLDQWRYVPIDTEFWRQFESFTKMGDDSSLAELLSEQVESRNELKKAEAFIALSQTLYGWGYPHLASRIALNILDRLPGSMPSAQALLHLQDLIWVYPVDENEISRVINSAKFKQIPANALSMVNYFVGMDNLKKGLKEWATQSFLKIEPKSIWYLKLQYYSALELVKTDKLEEALNLIQEIDENINKINLDKTINNTSTSVLYADFKNHILLQKARILVELKRYEEAKNIYKNNTFNRREYGRGLLESAWLYYREKNLSQTLGTLESLKSPYFLNSRNPENYILEMLTYKELCYYESVQKVKNEFFEQYDETLRKIKNNVPLEQNRELVRLVVQSGNQYDAADYVALLRQEQNKTHKGFKKLSSTLRKQLAQFYEEDEKYMLKKNNHAIYKELKNASEYLLKMSEQIKIIDYVASLDEYRIQKQFENRIYESEKINKFDFIRLFWPVEKEYWSDEMNHYTAYVKDHCHQIRSGP